MRIAIAKIFQETDTFNPVSFGLQDFERFGITYGQEIIDRSRGVGEIGGFVSVVEAQPEPVELIPIISATSWAGGRWTSEAMEFLKGKLISGLDGALPVDGVLLSLHGAMASEGIDDAAGHLLSAVRHLVGDDIPVVASLDHHANITRAMIESADGLVGYRECPHTDTLETGMRAANLVFPMLRQETRPVMALRKIPMVTPADNFLTAGPPLKDWFEMAADFERRPDVLSVALFPVQPWFDVPELGWSTIVITNGNASLAQQLAAELANYAWARRHEFFGAELVSPGEAVRQAAEAREGPVILADGSDNMNSGAPGDSTCLLREMLRQEIQCVALLPMVDPEAVEAAIGVGIGSEVTLLVGGKRDHIFSHPVEVTGRVTRTGDGQVRSTGHLPIAFDMGRTVLLEVGSIKIVLSEHPGPSHEPEVYQHLDLDPCRAQIVVVKTPVGFRVAYRSIMKQALIVDCPGLSTPHLESLDYVRVPRPLFPFDDIPGWHA